MGNRTRWNTILAVFVALVVLAMGAVVSMRMRDVERQLRQNPPTVEPENHGDDRYTFTAPYGKEQFEKSLEAFQGQHPELECELAQVIAHHYIVSCKDTAIDAQSLTIP